MSSPYEYIAYIDEAGDPGLNRVRPIDPNGASEWLILSAVVVSRANEALVQGWVEELLRDMRSQQMKALHFKKLNPIRRSVACTFLASKPLRIFVLASNKKNMRAWTNPAAALVSNDINWFYCWMTRLLLERVTNWVEFHSLKEFGRPMKLRVEYSERGGLSYGQMDGYHQILQMRSRTGNLTLTRGDLKWSVMAPDQMWIYTHTERAGLILADIAASAFFAACDQQQSGPCEPQFAKLLNGKVARYKDDGTLRASGFGVKLLPGFRAAGLTPQQQEIFRFYGYPGEWWDPDQSTPRA